MSKQFVSTRKAAEGLIKFINASPSPYHAVKEIKERLLTEGFEELKESLPWTIQRGKRYFTTRHNSAILAFIVPRNTEEASLCIAAAHVDSPCLRVRPVSSKPNSEGFVQVGVETYGGGLWHTWFDRDLAVAGRLVTSVEESLEEHLVLSTKPIMRIPTLAIHLDRSVSDGFKFNNETHLLPVMATAFFNETYCSTHNASQQKQHNVALLDELLPKDKRNNEELKVYGLDLCLYDAQLATIGGVHDEFIFAGRLDNLCMSYCVLEGLLESASIQDSCTIKIGIWFDHEEVGSGSAVGAEGGLMENVVGRVCSSLHISDVPSVWANSLIVSADMAHAAHPNYPEKHERCMRPQLHNGMVIKYNAQQRYATSSRSASIIKTIAEKAGLQTQDFEVRNDSPCGSTIGPMLGAASGAETVDIGLPQLSMHSCREMMSAEDVGTGVALLSAVFTHFNPKKHL